MYTVLRRRDTNMQGLTLVELLVTLSVIAIVMAIAVPLFTNLVQNAQQSASTAQAAALDAFRNQYAATDLEYNSSTNETTATLNGVVLARISGNATGIAPISLTYAGGSIFAGSDRAQVGPSVTGGLSTDATGKTYSYTGTLPENVTFNTATGVFTGPGGSEWSIAPMKGGGTGWDAGKAVAVAADGSILVTGNFQGTASFGSTTLTSAGAYDVFVGKISAAGTWLWALRAGGTGDDDGRGISASSDGSVLITGSFSDSATFGSTTLTSSGVADIFTAKVSSSGSWTWVTKAGASNYDYGNGIVAAPDGSALVTGQFASFAAKFGSTTFNSSGNYDVFIAKISAAGTWLWAVRAGGSNIDESHAVALLPGGGAAITGIFTGTATFGSTTLTSAGNTDMFIARISDSGTWTWAVRAGGATAETGTGIAAGSDGSIVATGSFRGTATFGSTMLTSAGTTDVFVAKLTSTGDWTWTVRAGGTMDEAATGIAIADDGSAVVTGSIAGTSTFGSTTVTSTAGADVFVAKLTSAGSWAWATKSGGISFESGRGIAISGNGNVVVIGTFEGTGTYGSSTLTSSGSSDMFVEKLTANGTIQNGTRPGWPATVTVTVTDSTGSQSAQVTLELQ